MTEEMTADEFMKAAAEWQDGFQAKQKFRILLTGKTNSIGTTVTGQPEQAYMHDLNGIPERVYRGTLSPTIASGVPVFVSGTGVAGDRDTFHSVAWPQFAAYTGVTGLAAYLAQFQIGYGDSSGNMTSADALTWSGAQMAMYSETGGASIAMTGYSSVAGNNPFIYGRKSRGTKASPTAVTSGDVLTRFSGEGFADTAFNNVSDGAIDLEAAENFDSTHNGTLFRFKTTPTGGSTTKADALIVGADKSLETKGGFKAAIITVTTTTTLDGTHHTVLCDATGGAITINLPALATLPKIIYNVKKIDVSANNVTIDGSGAETIDGSATKVISAQYASYTIQAGASEWSIIGKV